jgi:hypothetical protein
MKLKNNKTGEIIRLIITIILAVVLGVLAYGIIRQLSNASFTARIELDNLADRKARCDSIGGHFGREKCYKDGEEMFVGGEK